MLDAPVLVMSIQTRSLVWQHLGADVHGCRSSGWTLLLSFPLDSKEKSEICMKEGKDGGRDGNKQ